MMERKVILDPGAYSFKMLDIRSRHAYEIRSCMYRHKGEQIYGVQALQAYWEKGKSRILYPFSQGKTLLDIRGILRQLAESSGLLRRLLKPRALVILPQDILEEEKSSWISACTNVGFRKVDFVSTMDLLAVENGLVIHAGHSCTEMAVYHHSSQIAYQKLMFAGMQMDEKIVDRIAGEYKALVFNEDAAELRMRSSEAFQQKRNPRLSCTVLDYTSHYVRLEIPALQLWPAMEEVLMQIVYWARDLVAQHGAAVMETVLSSPIRISGGLAGCYGLRQMLEEQLGAAVEVAENPSYALLYKGADYMPPRSGSHMAAMPVRTAG